MRRHRRNLLTAAAIFLLALLAGECRAGTAFASYGNTHFGHLAAAASPDSLAVTGDLQGTGKQLYVDLVLTATSDCGGPASSDTGLIPVTGGTMAFTVALPAPCAGVVWNGVSIAETVTGASQDIPGTWTAP